MAPVQPVGSPEDTKNERSLTKVLVRSEHAKDLVKESAEELSSANLALNAELEDRHPPPRVETALRQIGDAEHKVQEASAELSVVNRALKDEVGERPALERQLAAITQERDRARHASFHDPLTSLPNRALFNDRVEHGLAEAQRHGWTLAVMFMDLDDFKSVNDSYGHDAGDEVLRTVAKRLKEHTRAEDTLCRHGGDEFLYLLITENADEQAIALVAEKIVNVIQEPFALTVRGASISARISASIGFALYPEDGATVDALVASADKAMYLAKRSKSVRPDAGNPDG